MTFPATKTSSPENFTDAYFNELTRASATIPRGEVAKAADLLSKTYTGNHRLFVCGNGGSAAISNHLVCDHGKLLSTGTDLLPEVHSLACNVEVITAIANDLSYDEVFELQLKLQATPEDVLMTVSSSGNSENIVRAAKWAKQKGMQVISLTGFSGGRSAEIADINIHVDADNYGIIEDLHQSVMHLLGQYIRQQRHERSEISGILF